MIISSKHNDYYDKAIAYGIDSHLRYVRENKEFDIDREDKLARTPLFAAAQLIGYRGGQNHCGAIGFCGKVYPFFRIYFGNRSKVYYSYASILKDVESQTFRDSLFEDFQPIYKASTRHKVDEAIDNLRSCGGARRVDKYDARIIDQYYGVEVEDEVFRYFDSPVILVWGSKFKSSKDYMKIYGEVNPILRQFEFIKVFDPYSAFQEISMYLGTNLVKQIDPAVNHSDELKAEIHGFDEWSFRKQGKKSKK
jgi:hypothetical protein